MSSGRGTIDAMKSMAGTVLNFRQASAGPSYQEALSSKAGSRAVCISLVVVFSPSYTMSVNSVLGDVVAAVVKASLALLAADLRGFKRNDV